MTNTKSGSLNSAVTVRGIDVASVIDDSVTVCGISWGGFNLSGDSKSIREVRRLLLQQERLAYFEEQYRSLLSAECPCQVRRET